MALKGVSVLALLFFSLLFCHPSSARDLKKLNKFQKNHPVSGFNESYFTSISNTYNAGLQTYYNTGDEYQGASAQISLWEIPNVKPNSASQFAIAVGYQGETGQNVIMAGFHVYPSLYKNNDLRFFTYWSTSIYGTTAGCYNTQCPGFIVANEANLHPGQAMATPLSTYNGEDIWGILTIKKDTKTQDWLLYRTYPGKTTFLGWWPHTVFTTLAGKANTIQFGGYVSFGSNEPSPLMGSGHLAAEGEKKAAYFKQVTIFNENGDGIIPSPDYMGEIQDQNGCYTVSSFSDDGTFYYGGPGGCKVN